MNLWEQNFKQMGRQFNPTTKEERRQEAYELVYEHATSLVAELNRLDPEEEYNMGVMVDYIQKRVEEEDDRWTTFTTEDLNWDEFRGKGLTRYTVLVDYADYRLQGDLRIYPELLGKLHVQLNIEMSAADGCDLSLYFNKYVPEADFDLSIKEGKDYALKVFNEYVKSPNAF